MSIKHYNTRSWLNKEDSHYTGSIVCSHFSDLQNRNTHIDEYAFVEFSDCHGKIRIHLDTNFGKHEFVEKLEIIREDLKKFIDHLEQ